MRQSFANYIKGKVNGTQNYFNQYPEFFNAAGIVDNVELIAIANSANFSSHALFNFVR